MASCSSTRVYTDAEIEYCTARKAATQHYAGRWAAKEAVLKALGTGWRRGIGWRDIEICNNRAGAPTVKLRVARGTSWTAPASSECTSRYHTAEAMPWRTWWRKETRDRGETREIYRTIGMSFLITERDVFAESIDFTDDAMIVHLDDGRAISVPLAWYPRLFHGAKHERNDYELIGDGQGIHWPKLDEDISVEGILAGRRSAESDTSLTRWLESRKRKSDA